MAERSELEAAHRQATWPPEPEPEPEPQPQPCEAAAHQRVMGELHRQLLRLAAYLLPDAAERAARAGLTQRVAELVRRSCLGLSLRQYGSEALGLAAFSSDITSP